MDIGSHYSLNLNLYGLSKLFNPGSINGWSEI